MSKDKSKGGRPLLFKTPDELQEAVDAYFDNELRPTLAGLAVHIGVGRKTLYNYDKRDEFLHIIKKAREKVEAIYESRLIYEQSPTGVIFALKNMDWRDKTETDVTTGGEKLTMPKFVMDEANRKKPD